MKDNNQNPLMRQISGMCNQIWNLVQKELKNNKEDQTIIIGKLNSLIAKQNDLNAKYEYLCERLEKLESKKEVKEESSEEVKEKINFITTEELTTHICKEYTDCITGSDVKKQNLLYAMNLLQLIEKPQKTSPYRPNSKFKGSEYAVMVVRDGSKRQTLEWTNEGLFMVINKLTDNNFIAKKVRT